MRIDEANGCREGESELEPELCEHGRAGPWWNCPECSRTSTYAFVLKGKGWTPKGGTK